jgi:hypothetical protein
MNDTHTLYYAALTADKAWQAELERQFGKNAGDVRYTKQGQEGPVLGPLFEEARRTKEAWHEALDRART